MNPGDDDKFAADIISSAIEIMKPVMESAIVLGSHYAKGCGRDTVTAMDVAYSMRYCAMNLVGKQIGSLFPEIYEESDSESEWETDSDQEEVEEEKFTRYEGTEELLNNINKAWDTWSTWEPQSPAERMLKNAIEKSG